MGTFQTLLEWFAREAPKDAERGEFCQCGSEKIIKKSSQPEKLRAVLLVAILIDQFIYTHYPTVYSQFRVVFKIPKLIAHPNPGAMHSPSWFIYSKHGYDKNVDWAAMTEIAEIILKETKDLLSQRLTGFSEVQFDVMLKSEIESEFEVQHQVQLLSAFHFDDSTCVSNNMGIEK